jgi:hypothetical protein
MFPNEFLVELDLKLPPGSIQAVSYCRESGITQDHKLGVGWLGPVGNVNEVVNEVGRNKGRQYLPSSNEQPMPNILVRTTMSTGCLRRRETDRIVFFFMGELEFDEVSIGNHYLAVPWQRVSFSWL